ncbi:plasmid mobilization protein [Tannerella forsythia]|nr:plasmid mobilization relaxosome protein MobC [Tannerella forsythia]
MMKKENRGKENRTEVLIIRLTKTEKDVLKQAAKNAHLSLSSYSKHAIFSQKIVSKTDVQTVFQLKKIGVNLNQLTKQINSLPSDNNIRYALKRVSEYIENLDKITSSIV